MWPSLAGPKRDWLVVISSVNMGYGCANMVAEFLQYPKGAIVNPNERLFHELRYDSSIKNDAYAFPLVYNQHTVACHAA